uniref:Putative disease resistance RPP13-like protein 1 n=1 Tax=Rhizophora mucronata TaxID=61149 RepID=A0A2P2KCW8_RHIMU
MLQLGCCCCRETFQVITSPNINLL